MLKGCRCEGFLQCKGKVGIIKQCCRQKLSFTFSCLWDVLFELLPQHHHGSVASFVCGFSSPQNKQGSRNGPITLIHRLRIKQSRLESNVDTLPEAPWVEKGLQRLTGGISSYLTSLDRPLPYGLICFSIPVIGEAVFFTPMLFPWLWQRVCTPVPLWWCARSVLPSHT